MREFDNSAFNEELYKRLLDQQRDVKNISPANISELNTGLVTQNNIFWDNNSSINGFSVRKINEHINYLRTQTVEKNFVTEDFIINKNTASLKTNIKLELSVPEGYDGKNCFILPLIYLANSAEKVGYGFSPSYLANIYCKHNNNDYDFKFSMIQNRNSIVFNLRGFDADNYSLTAAGISGSPVTITSFIFEANAYFWRFA